MHGFPSSHEFPYFRHDLAAPLSAGQPYFAEFGAVGGREFAVPYFRDAVHEHEPLLGDFVDPLVGGHDGSAPLLVEFADGGERWDFARRHFLRVSQSMFNASIYIIYFKCFIDLGPHYSNLPSKSLTLSIALSLSCFCVEKFHEGGGADVHGLVGHADDDEAVLAVDGAEDFLLLVLELLEDQLAVHGGLVHVHPLLPRDWARVGAVRVEARVAPLVVVAFAAGAHGADLAPRVVLDLVGDVVVAPGGGRLAQHRPQCLVHVGVVVFVRSVVCRCG